MTENPKSPASRAKKKVAEPIPGMITPIAPEAPFRSGNTPPAPRLPSAPPAPPAPPAPYGPHVPPGPSAATGVSAPAAAPQAQAAQGLMLESTARNLSMWSHLGPLLGTFVSIPGIIAALIFWMIGKDKSALVDHNGKESMNFQLSLLIVGLGSGAVFAVLAIVTIGFALFLIIPAVLVALVFIIMWQIQGAIAANNGQYYRYPMNWRMIP
jgi:hypothetical protein